MFQNIFLEANGLRFQALTAGPPEGELVLLLHGFPQFADSWTGIMGALSAAGYQVVAVDQRGYSAEARPLQVHEYGLTQLVSDVLGIADALGQYRFHLIGHDWGGAVAWAAAAWHPERLRTLAVLATPHLDAFAYALEHDAGQKLKSLYMLLFRAPGHAAETTLLAFNAKVLRGVYQGKVPAAEVERNVERMRADGALTAALNWYRANSFAVGIGPVRVSTLYLWGEDDVALGEVAALGTERYVEAPYRFVRLPGRSHWLIEEDADGIATEILTHLRSPLG